MSLGQATYKLASESMVKHTKQKSGNTSFEYIQEPVLAAYMSCRLCLLTVSTLSLHQPSGCANSLVVTEQHNLSLNKEESRQCTTYSEELAY